MNPVQVIPRWSAARHRSASLQLPVADVVAAAEPAVTKALRYHRIPPTSRNVMTARVCCFWAVYLQRCCWLFLPARRVA